MFLNGALFLTQMQETIKDLDEIKYLKIEAINGHKN